MRKFLFVFASTVALITPAVAQYGYQAFPPYKLLITPHVTGGKSGRPPDA